MTQLPVVAFILALATLVSSLVVAQVVTGSLLGKVSMIDLSHYGGVTVADIKKGQIWRLLTSQLVHSKQYHMLYNVVSLVLLGVALEKKVGGLLFVTVWLVAGAAGTLYSTLFVAAPWNTGSGGSQAIFGLIGLGLVAQSEMNFSRAHLMYLFFALVPALLLDLIYAHYPKPGHIMGLMVGMLIGVKVSRS